MYSYLKPQSITETFKTSKAYTDGLTDNFVEYERIARNKPHSSIPKEYPKTTDGTTASVIRKTPHRIIQQLPTGKVKSTTEDWLSVIAEFLYYNKIIPNANEDYALLQKCWSVVERFLTFGYCATYAPFVEHAGYFCTDLRLIYWGDIFLQPGKLSDTDSNYVFMRSWWQTKDIEALIDKQKKLSKENRTWDIDALGRVKEQVSAKEDKSQTPSERDHQTNTKGGIELITGFQRGVGAKFYTFHVASDEVVRTKENKDPRGELPISFAYGDIDGSNPFGRSVIDLVGSLQNLMDGEMQMYQYNRALQLNPPLIKRGNFSKNKVKFAPNIIIDVGSDPNAGVEPLVIDTTALANFPNNYGLMKSQMLNLLASPDTSISAEVGNPGFSKTPQGVEASKANLNIDDNYVRKQFETWFERWSETAINLYFAERTGVEELQLDQDTVDSLMELAKKGRFDPKKLSPDNKIRIDYDSATEQLKFEVDASTSKKQDEIQELQSLQGLSAYLDKSEFLQQILPPEKKIALWNAIAANSGTDHPEKLKLSEDEIKQAIQALANQPSQKRENVITNYKDLPEDIKRQQERELGFEQSQMASPAQMQIEGQNQQQPDTSAQLTPDHVLKVHQQTHQEEMDKAKLELDARKIEGDQQIAKDQLQVQASQPAGESKTPKAPVQPKLTPEDQQLIEMLRQMGVPEPQIQQAVAMLHAGKSVEEILTMLGIGNGRR